MGRTKNELVYFIWKCAMDATISTQDITSACAKLPASLTRSIGSFISNYVILRDPKRNNIQVSIEKRNNKIYFAQGWTRLRDFYGFTAGGWVTILYISPLLFNIKWACSISQLQQYSSTNSRRH